MTVIGDSSFTTVSPAVHIVVTVVTREVAYIVGGGNVAGQNVVAGFSATHTIRRRWSLATRVGHHFNTRAGVVIEVGNPVTLQQVVFEPSVVGGKEVA